MNTDFWGCQDSINIQNQPFKIAALAKLQQKGFKISHLPFSIKILLEQALRNFDNIKVTEADIQNLANWGNGVDAEIPFQPTRVILQDFTGVPSLVDLAALRDSMQQMGKNPDLINPEVPVDLIIDHSIQVDQFGSSNALNANMQREFERNQERYEFIKWGAMAFKNFRVFPPGVGIIHQVNLEYLAQVVHSKNGILFPDTVVGTDSHTTMINGIGVLGWGVGGIEAEAAMLGQPIFMKIPEVIGIKLSGTMPAGTTATDLVLRVTEMLRQYGVVEKFVEFYGDGLASLSLPDRATIANMAPEYGATASFFPVDTQTLNYMLMTGRDKALAERAKTYAQAQGLFREENSADPIFTDTLSLNLDSIEPSLAGPKRPQDRVRLKDMQNEWQAALTKSTAERGFGLAQSTPTEQTTAQVKGQDYALKNGSVVIAAITSCTNTSNPSVMLAAGLLAKKAVQKGLQTKPWVKTSLAPGSRVVTDYLENSGLDQFLNQLGFYNVGYGCTTCIGNSGPLPEPIAEAVVGQDLVVASVLSGNRNFEGRVHNQVKANYLASPPLVVAYALAGTVDIDLYNSPLGKDAQGQPVFLADIWPSAQEIVEATEFIQPELYRRRYQNFQNVSENWNKIQSKTNTVFNWNENSTYIQNPPFFHDIQNQTTGLQDIKNARVLVKVGDSVTTDHISPAGSFASKTPAGKYLQQKGVDLKDFNSYGSRRGNDKIMVRGTFANVRLRNQLVDQEGGFTQFWPTGEVMPIFDAAELYRQSNTPLVVLAGLEYGTGSSRDWAAKGPLLLGVRAVIAASYERIHRSNLIGMGVLPLQFLEGQTHQSLGLTGKEQFSVLGMNDDIKPKAKLTLQVDNQKLEVLCRLDTPVEINYYKNGGILHTALRNFAKAS